MGVVKLITGPWLSCKLTYTEDGARMVEMMTFLQLSRCLRSTTEFLRIQMTLRRFQDSRCPSRVQSSGLRLFSREEVKREMRGKRSRACVFSSCNFASLHLRWHRHFYSSSMMLGVSNWLFPCSLCPFHCRKTANYRGISNELSDDATIYLNEQQT